ncbi:hypothetical protein HanIR_Chr09g0396541 [Helianthus annuus]|nr:hypothetical protein HanIR_Chr09g0396541 [Helianthus annuus]
MSQFMRSNNISDRGKESNGFCGTIMVSGCFTYFKSLVHPVKSKKSRYSRSPVDLQR